MRRNRPLRMSDAEAIRNHATHAQQVAVKVYGESDLRYENRILRSVRLKGISHEIMLIEPYDVQSGRPLGEEDNARSAAVAFLGADIAEQLFGPIDPVGKAVKISGRSFEVVGVAAQRGSVFGQSRDDYALIPVNTFRKMFGSRDSVALVVRARDPAAIEQAMDEVRVVLRARHHVRYGDDDDFGMVSAEALNTLWKSMTRTIFQVALFVVGISLVVGGIVIMNIMLVSVIERTREIGVRKAIGARTRDIRRQFLMESVALAAAGGLTGVAIAYGITRAVARFSPLPAAFPWWAASGS